VMSSVGRRTEHARKTTIELTGSHADFAKEQAALMRVSALLQEWVVRVKEQLNPIPFGYSSKTISSILLPALGVLKVSD
jgi:hypothetical protein